LLLDRTWIVEAPRLALPEPLAPGETATMDLPVEVPTAVRGPAYLRISLVQETVRYFDDADPANGLWATLYVVPATTGAADA
jgi:hypothetical protein